MVFSAMLTDNQVAQLYAATWTPPPATANIDLAAMPSGLVGYWPMDATAEDVSGTDLPGTLVAPEFVTGHWGSAFFFDGDDALVVSDGHPTQRLPVPAAQKAFPHLPQ